MTARAFGRHDAVALPHEQRIVEMRAQPVQRVRDCRLRQVQRTRGRADPAMHVDGVEHAEQVQVETMIGGQGRAWRRGRCSDSKGCGGNPSAPAHAPAGPAARRLPRRHAAQPVSIRHHDVAVGHRRAGIGSFGYDAVASYFEIAVLSHASTQI
jgi:hypothetical protein